MPPKIFAQDFLNDCIRARGLAPHSVEDGCADAVRELFYEIYKRLKEEAARQIPGCEHVFYERLGLAEAWRIFGRFRPPSGRKRKWIRDCALLDRYDFRHSKGWGAERVAKEIAEDNARIREANKKLPQGQREHGLCKGSTSVPTIERHLNRVLADRRQQKWYDDYLLPVGTPTRKDDEVWAY